MNHNNRFECKIKTVTQSQKINQIKNNIDPSIIKPNEPDKDKVKISFTDIKKEEKKKKKEIDKKENDKKKEIKIPGTRLIESIKQNRKDLIVKPEKIKIDGMGKSDKLKEKNEKLQKLKDLLKELKEHS
jgi:hypothetical protein